MRRISLDSRELEHPKPLEMAIDILKSLDKDSYMYMLNRRNPIPLINLASTQNFKTLSKELAPNQWHILITPNTEVSLEEFLDV